MKVLTLLVISFLATACDPYGFGFKHNPAWVLDSAFKAVQNLDQETLIEVSGKEALCLYGNERGINFLKENLSIDADQVTLSPKLLESKHFQAPQFVGYWSYFHERYLIDILAKESKELLLQAVVDCEYGTDEEKDSKLLNLKRLKYKKKECRLVKVLPKNFQPLPFNSRCDVLKVTL